MREIVPEMHTQGPTKCYRERATDDATGFTIWAASVLFARWVREHPELFAGRDVLELGAGCGLGGVTVACSASAHKVLLTDFPLPTMENLLYNVGRNCARTTPCSAAAADASAVRMRVAGRELTLEDAFTSLTGTAVALTRMDWDEPKTWPRVPAPLPGVGAPVEGPQPFAQWDVIFAVDCFYRRSYARKVAVVVKQLLRPGGIFIVATPTAREGLQVLEDMMRDSGFLVSEEPFPLDWRVSPLRAPPCDGGEGDSGEGLSAALGHLGTGGVLPAPRDAWQSGESGDLIVPMVLDLHTAALDEGAPAAESPAPEATLRLVSEERSRTMFPELFMPSYQIICMQFTRPGEGS